MRSFLQCSAMICNAMQICNIKGSAIHRSSLEAVEMEPIAVKVLTIVLLHLTLAHGIRTGQLSWQRSDIDVSRSHKQSHWSTITKVRWLCLLLGKRNLMEKGTMQLQGRKHLHGRSYRAAVISQVLTKGNIISAHKVNRLLSHAAASRLESALQ